MTALGRKFLELTRTRFEWMNKELTGDELLSHKDMPYCVAYFGPSAFYGTELESLSSVFNSHSRNSGNDSSVFGGLLLGGMIGDSFGGSDSGSDDGGSDYGSFGDSDSGGSDGGSGCGGCGGGCGGGD